MSAMQLLAGAGLLATFGCGDDGPTGGTTSSGDGGGGHSAGGGGAGAGGVGGSSSGGGGGAADCGDSAISANHGHELVVPWADVLAGQDKSYSIQGGATHDHQVTLTAADLSKLMVGDPVTVTSTTTAQHSHQVAVSCP